MSRFWPATALGAALILQSGSALTAAPASDRDIVRDRDGHRSFTFACGARAHCRSRERYRQAGPADRAVFPFEGSLGRPCAYRVRYTPQGNRRVRVCY